MYYVGTKYVLIHTLGFDDNKVLNGQLMVLMFKLSAGEFNV